MGDREDTLRFGRSPYFTKYGRSRLYHADFLEAERMAMAEERGLWAGTSMARQFVLFISHM